MPINVSNTMMSTALPQSCNVDNMSPSTVILKFDSSSLDERDGGGGDDGNDKTVDRNIQRRLLVENLSWFGWTPIRIEGCNIHPPTQEKIKSCFVSTLAMTDDKNHVTYIASESGATVRNNGGDDQVDDNNNGSNNNTDVEPKESYELKLEDCQMSSENNDNQDSTVDDISKQKVAMMKQWCMAMSKIAELVISTLGIPRNTLLLPSDRSLSDTTSTSLLSSTTSLDLLRVFHYYAVEEYAGNDASEEERRQQQEHEQEQQRCQDNIPSRLLGSSPHTDWGSLTIVWQDHVGGLQTYCRTSKRWVDVAPPPPHQTLSSSTSKQQQQQQVDSEKSRNISSMTSVSNETDWNCIVHVGDMASLVLGRESIVTENDIATATGVETHKDHASGREVEQELWPSPKHRVVNSTSQDRTSLVFFGYPPPDKSLKELEQSLTEWKQHNPVGRRLPYKDYYLLQDQSATTSSKHQNENNDNGRRSLTALLPDERYKSIRELPIRDVVHQKWEQVQR